MVWSDGLPQEKLLRGFFWKATVSSSRLSFPFPGGGVGVQEDRAPEMAVERTTLHGAMWESVSVMVCVCPCMPGTKQNAR